MARRRRKYGHQADFTSALGITSPQKPSGPAAALGSLPPLPNGIKAPPTLGVPVTGTGYSTVPPRATPTVQVGQPASTYMTPQAQQQARQALTGAASMLRSFTSQGAQSQGPPAAPPTKIGGGRASGSGGLLAPSLTQGLPDVAGVISNQFAAGANWLGSVFNSEDTWDRSKPVGQQYTPGDLTIAGKSFGGVESSFDSMLAGLGWTYDRVSQAGSYVNAAAPGGTEPMTWDESNDVSYGQSATTANAQLVNQFRDNLGPAGGVVGSVYGFITNPVGALGSAAGLASENQGSNVAPFTARGFDPRDPVQRKAAYEDSTVGRWSTGIADTITATFADPTIALGVAGKISKLRYLDQLVDTPQKVARAIQETDYAGKVATRNLPHFGKDAIEDLTREEMNQLTVAPVGRFLHSVVQREETAASKAVRQRYIDEGGDAVAANDIPREYSKVMKETQIDQYLARIGATNREALKSALYNARTYEEAETVLHHAWGDTRAQAKLRDLRPDLAVEVMNGERTLLRKLVQADPVGLRKQAESLRVSYENAEARLRALTDTSADRSVIVEAHATASEAYDLTHQADTLVGERARYDSLESQAKTASRRKQPDAQEIANLREEMDVLMEGWRHVSNGEVPMVGTGLGATQEEIDLLTRSIAAQVQHNALFEASLGDARAAAHGVMGTLVEAKGGFARGVTEEGGIGNKVLNQFGKAVESSRMTRAGKIAYTREAKGAFGAEYEYARETGMNPAKAVVEAVNQRRAAWRADEFYGVNRFNPVARVWHWMGGEVPSGTITTSGIGAQESGREVRAMLTDIPFYNTRAVQARDAYGKPIWLDEAKTVPKMVGGTERRESIVMQYENALLEGGASGDYKIRQLLDSVEEEMLQDVAERHGIDLGLLRSMHYHANQELKKIETTIRDKGYWIDNNGTQNEVPWLEAHLQNSTFMQNWKKIDQAAAQMAKKGASYKVGQIKRSAFATGTMVNAGFQEVWRPSVLLRLGYTQRNVAEGLFRATAFQWSLAPLGMAGKQGVLSLGTTRAVRAASGRSGAAVRKVVDQASERGMTIENMTSPRFQRWHAAQVQEADAEIERVRGIATFAHERLAEGSPEYRGYAIQRRQEKAKIVRTEIDAIDAAIPKHRQQAIDKRAEADALDIDMNGSDADIAKREAQAATLRRDADALNRRVDELQGRRDTLVDDQANLFEESHRLRELGPAEGELSMDDRALADTITWLEDVDLVRHQRIRQALDSPLEAATAYRKQTLAKRRIGDGSYSGPDIETMQAMLRDSELTPKQQAERALTDEMGGRLMAGAFDKDSSYSAIALGNSSSDITQKSYLTARQSAVTSALDLMQTRHYVNVSPDDPEYMDGVASVLNQMQHSGVGRIVIDGRAAGKADEAIHDDVVRYLTSDPDGIQWASVLQQINDTYFAGDAIGVRERWADAMTKALSDNQHLADAEDATREALAQAHRTASGARLNRRTPRWEGDAPLEGRRSWDGLTYGEHTVSTEGRGKWVVTNTRTGDTVTATTKDAARTAAKNAQDTLDAHWTSGPALKTDEEIAAHVGNARDAHAKAVARHEEAMGRIVPENNGGRITSAEREDMVEYAAEVLSRYDQITVGDADLQRHLSTSDLPTGAQGRTSRVKRTGQKEEVTTGREQRHATGEAGQVIGSYLDKYRGTGALQPVVGNMAAVVGTPTITHIFRKGSQEAFRLLGAVPENTMVRWPFYSTRYAETVETLFDNAKALNGKVTLKDVNAIREAAHRRALKDTKDWLYTIDRRTNFGAVMENWLPFSQATQNSISTVGRLVWRDPTIPGIMGLIWNAPNRSGLASDPEHPNSIVIPLDWVPQGVRDTFGLSDELVINKESLDLIFNGIIDPSMTPLVGIASSELMKNGLFGMYTVDGPDWLKPISQSLGFDVWGAYKDRIYGSQGGVSQNTLSYDKALSAWQKNGIDMFFGGDGSADSFARVFGNIWTAELAKWQGGMRDTPPQEPEVSGIASRFGALRFASNLLLFTTPKYETQEAPIMKAIAANDAAHAADVAANGLNATSLPSEEMYTTLVQASMMSTSKPNAGVVATLGDVDRSMRYKDLISKASKGLESTGDLGSLGMVLMSADEVLAQAQGQPLYDPDAAAWQVANTIPGTTTTYRSKVTGAEMALNATKSAGWSVYLKAKDQIDAVLAQRPHKSIEANGNEDMKARQEQLVASMKDNPNFAGWYDDKQDQDGGKAAAVTRLMEVALTDPVFLKDHANDEVWRRGGIAEQYLEQRSAISRYRDAVDAEYDAKRMTYKDQQAWHDSIEASWAETQAQLAIASPEWAVLKERFLRTDDTPWNAVSGATFVEGGDFAPLGQPVKEGAR